MGGQNRKIYILVFSCIILASCKSSITTEVNGTKSSSASVQQGDGSSGDTITEARLDSIAPMPSNFGETSQVSASGFVLNWSAATDDVSDEAQLQYAVCSGPSAVSVQSVESCVTATKVMDWTPHALTLPVTGATPNTTYFFNVIVRDEAGNMAAYSGRSQVTGPAIGSFDSSSAITPLGFMLHWTAATIESTPQASLEYYVCSGPSDEAIATIAGCESAVQEMPWTANTVSVPVAGKAPGTTYHFNIVVRDPSGNKSIYVPARHTTAPDTTAPVPGNGGVLTISNVSATSLKMDWAAASDNVSPPTAIQYEIRRSTSNNMATADGAQANGVIAREFASSIGTATLTGLSPLQTYHFTIIARDQAGNKSVYTARSATTTADVTPPVPGNSGTITLTALSAGRVTMNWAAASDDASSQASLCYEIYYRLDQWDGGNFLQTLNDIDSEYDFDYNHLVCGVQQLTLRDLEPSSLTHFNIIVTDEAGNRRVYQSVSVTTPADTQTPQPGNTGAITVTDISATTMTIRWAPAADDGSDSCLVYQVVRSNSPNIGTVAEIELNGTVVQTFGSYWAYAPYDNTSLRVSVSGLAPTTTNHFNVLAKDCFGHKIAYARAQATSSADLVAPSATSYALSVELGSPSLRVTWTKATDNAAAQANLLYQVRRSTSNNIGSLADAEANGTIAQDFTANIATFSDGILAGGTVFYYNVIVKDPSGNKRAYSSTTGTTPLFPGPDSTSASSAQRKTFFDTLSNRHWAFIHSGATIEYAYSPDGVSGWTSVSTLPYDTSAFALSFRVIAGTPWVFLAAQGNDHDVVLLRGALSPTSIAFDAPVTVFDGSSTTNRFEKPTISLDGNDRVWIAALYIGGHAALNKSIKARRSTNIGSGDLTPWLAAASVGTTTSANEIILLPQSGNAMALIASGGDITGFTFNGGVWSDAHTGGNYAWLSADPTIPFGSITATAIAGGDIYLGGDFTDWQGNGHGDRIVRWNGSSWNALGTGLNGTVRTIAVSGSNVYVGGDFTDAGGNNKADRIARWNGSSWLALGDGLSSFVWGIAVSGNDVYAAGAFSGAGGLTAASGIARWDGAQWNALGSGLNGTGRTVVVSGSDVFVGGFFSNAGGNSNADNIARWDGSSWQALGTGLGNGVTSIALMGGSVYAGGYFDNAGGIAEADRIARWDGTSWNALGSGFSLAVFAIAINGGNVYAGGGFVDAGGDSNADYIARWDGSTWHALGAGLSLPVFALAFSDGVLVAGGDFNSAGSDSSANKVAQWNGTSWNAINTSTLSSHVRTIAISGGDVYIGGAFINAFGNPDADRIVRWNGSNWTALGTGLNAQVNSLAVSGSNVFVGGSFTTAGGVTNADRIARWDGTNWNAMGSGISNAEVNAVAVSGSNVYVGGSFVDAGGNGSADKIAWWDGSTWTPVGFLNTTVFAIAISGSDIYAGGAFENAGGFPEGDYIARWNGATWNPLDTGLNNVVYAIAINGSNVYVGGDFTDAGAIPTADRIARWNGSNWNSLGPGLNGTVRTIAVSGNDVYAGGTFTDAGGVATADYLARWDAANWQTVYSMTVGSVPNQLTAANGNVYIGLSNSFRVYGQSIAPTFDTVSAVTDDSDNIHLVYRDAAGKATYRKFDGSAWSAATNLTTATDSRTPVISIDHASGDLYSFWSRSAGGIHYVRYTSGAWATTPTSILGPTTTDHLSADFKLQDGKIQLLWTNLISSGAVSGIGSAMVP